MNNMPPHDHPELVVHLLVWAVGFLLANMSILVSASVYVGRKISIIATLQAEQAKHASRLQDHSDEIDSNTRSLAVIEATMARIERALERALGGG